MESVTFINPCRVKIYRGVKIQNNSETSSIPIRTILIADSDWLSDYIASTNQSNFALGMNMVEEI